MYEIGRAMMMRLGDILTGLAIGVAFTWVFIHILEFFGVQI